MENMIAESKEMLTQIVQRIVDESGCSTGFDANAWVEEWINQPNPALGFRSISFIAVNYGCEVSRKPGAIHNDLLGEPSELLSLRASQPILILWVGKWIRSRGHMSAKTRLPSTAGQCIEFIYERSWFRWRNGRPVSFHDFPESDVLTKSCITFDSPPKARAIQS